MSTPITTLWHREQLRQPQESASQHNHLSINRFAASQSFGLRHYAAYLVLRGELSCQVDHQRFQVPAGHFLVLNAGQALRLTTHEAHEVLCLHLTAEALQQALQQLDDTPDWAELQSCLRPDHQIELCEQVYRANAHALGRYLQQLADGIQQDEAALPDDLAAVGAEAARLLITTQIDVYRQLLKLTSAKLSTKRELYRRLCMARVHMHAHLDEGLDLDTLAQVACLSKYHFIRLFKEAFGQTPRQYLIARRLERASSLLIHSTKTFHEICHEVGLKDSSSFGRLFKRSFGATPHLYRQMHNGH
jgi:AraC-like DNA-binding protein